MLNILALFLFRDKMEHTEKRGKLPKSELNKAVHLIVPVLANLFLVPSLFYRDQLAEQESVQLPNDNGASAKSEPLYNSKVVFDRHSVGDPETSALILKLTFTGCLGIGGLVAGVLSDKFSGNRKYIAYIFLTVSAAGGMLSAHAPHMFLFRLKWSVLLPLGTMGYYAVVYVHLVEILPDWARLTVPLGSLALTWFKGRMLGILFFYLDRDWHSTLFFVSFTVALHLLVVHLIERSPKAERRLKERPENNEYNPETWNQLFTNSKMRSRLLAISSSWFFCGIIIFGLNHTRHRLLSPDHIFNQLFFGLTDLSAQSTIALLCMVSKRTKIPLTMALAFAGLALFGLVWLGQCSVGDLHLSGGSGSCWNLFIWATICVRFFAAASWNVVWLATVLAFPRRLRNTAIGVCVLLSCLGGVLGTVIVDHGLLFTNGPVKIVSGSLALISGLLVYLFLPENGNKPLLESIEYQSYFVN